MAQIDIIDKLLVENGKSGAQMSRDLGFSSGVYSQWKRGLQKPSNKSLQKIADYFNVPVNYLLTGEEQKNSPPDETVSNDEQELLGLWRTALPEGKHAAVAVLKSYQ